MHVNVPQDIADAAGLTEESCLVELACHLYAGRRLPFGQALRLSGLSRDEFERQLAERGISLYTVEDLESDLQTLRELGRI